MRNLSMMKNLSRSPPTLSLPASTLTEAASESSSPSRLPSSHISLLNGLSRFFVPWFLHRSRPDLLITEISVTVYTNWWQSSQMMTNCGDWLRFTQEGNKT
ncbi:hypothetical protein V6Z12_D10G174500 [Gossypium hirsutum]